MIIDGFVWPAWVVEKIVTRHHLRPEEVEQVFLNNPQKRRKVEQVKHLLYGRTDAGRYLLVVFAFLPVRRRARIISARDMTNAERRYFDRS